jgi:hypothetical protein
MGHEYPGPSPLIAAAYMDNVSNLDGPALTGKRCHGRRKRLRISGLQCHTCGAVRRDGAVAGESLAGGHECDEAVLTYPAAFGGDG